MVTSAKPKCVARFVVWKSLAQFAANTTAIAQAEKIAIGANTAKSVEEVMWVRLVLLA